MLKYLNSYTLQGAHSISTSLTFTSTNVHIVQSRLTLIEQSACKDDLLAVLVGCNDSEPIPDIVLLQELLCQVFEIPAPADELFLTQASWR